MSDPDSDFEAPESQAPESQAPESQAPEPQAPEPQAPEPMHPDEVVKKSKKSRVIDDPHGWANTRETQALHFVREFGKASQGNIRHEVISEAGSIITGVVSFCRRNMGVGDDHHFKPPGKPQLYGKMGNHAVWAAFALQQAFFESNKRDWKCGDEHAASQWNIRTLCKFLEENKVGSIQNTDDVAATVAPGVLTASSKRPHTPRVDNIGNDKELKAKAVCFYTLFLKQFGRDREFCPGICKLEQPSFDPPPATVSQNAEKRAKKEEAWKRNVMARTPIQDKPQTPVPYENGTARVHDVENGIGGPSASSKKKQKKKQTNVEEQLQVNNAWQTIGDLRKIQGLDFTSEETERIIATRAHEARMKREVGARAAEAMTTLMLANVKAGLEYEYQMQGPERLCAEWVNTIIRRNAIIERTHDLDGNEVPGEIDKLSPEERDLVEKPEPPRVETWRMARVMPVALVREQFRVPCPEYCNTKKQKDRIDEKVSAPGERVDFATIFGFQSEAEADELIKSMEDRLCQAGATVMTDSGLGFADWQLWFYHLTQASLAPPRGECLMKQALEEYQIQYNQEVEKRQKVEADEQHQKKQKQEAAAKKAADKEIESETKRIGREMEKDRKKREKRALEEEQKEAKETTKRAREEEQKEKQEAKRRKADDTARQNRLNKHKKATAKGPPKDGKVVRLPGVDNPTRLEVVWREGAIKDYHDYTTWGLKVRGYSTKLEASELARFGTDEPKLSYKYQEEDARKRQDTVADFEVPTYTCKPYKNMNVYYPCDWKVVPGDSEAAAKARQQAIDCPWEWDWEAMKRRGKRRK